MIGVESNLPSPYNKYKQNILPVKLEINDGYDIKDIADQVETRYKFQINKNNKISSVNIFKNSTNYIYNFNTDILTGELLFDKNKNKYISDLEFVRLDNIINKNSSTENSFLDDMDLFNLPNIEGVVKKLYIDNILFGRLEHDFSSVKDKNIFKLNTIKLKNDFLDLDFSGINSKNNETKTSLNGSYKLKSISKLARIIGEDSITDKIKLTGKFNLNWPAELFSPTLDSINGKVMINSGFGRIADIEPGIGRIFSFFNLDSLDKRLRFRFF